MFRKLLKIDESNFSLTKSQRIALILVVYSIIWASSLLLAYGVRFDFYLPEILNSQPTPLVYLLLFSFCYASFFYWKMYEIPWRHISTRDLSIIIQAHISVAIVLSALLALSGISNFPRSVTILNCVFSIIGCISAPLCVRLFFESIESKQARNSARLTRETIVIGAGKSGYLLIKTLQSQKKLSYKPIGVLDDNASLRGRNVLGVEVIGKVADLSELIDANPKISVVILAIPSLSSSRIREIEQVCAIQNIILKRIQSFEDIALTDIEYSSRSVASIESVLQRDVSVSHDTEIRKFIAGQRVVVTGAGGSIGSELARQILNFSPKSLTLIDANEFHIFKLRRELENEAPEVDKSFLVANIVDEARMGSIFQEYKPKVLFHAAAFKHVPLMEENPYEAIQNNVIGTRNLLRSCITNGVEQFIFISTDKAVNSCSVMGHTKRIGELLVQEYTAMRSGNQKPFKSAIVRFGNVINSNGSVVPLFKEQILSGGPVTVTHPDMKRFFMSIREAVRLVLAAGTIGHEGEVFLLDMGQPVKIEDVARKMLALYGRRDIQIVYSGIRPGERLFEELTGPGEKTYTTSLSKVRRVVGPATHKSQAILWVDAMEKLLPGLNGNNLRDALHQFVWGGAEELEKQVS